MIPSIVGSHVLELFSADPVVAAQEATTLPKLKISKLDLQWLQVLTTHTHTHIHCRRYNFFRFCDFLHCMQSSINLHLYFWLFGFHLIKACGTSTCTIPYPLSGSQRGLGHTSHWIHEREGISAMSALCLSHGRWYDQSEHPDRVACGNQQQGTTHWSWCLHSNLWGKVSNCRIRVLDFKPWPLNPPGTWPSSVTLSSTLTGKRSGALVSGAQPTPNTHISSKGVMCVYSILLRLCPRSKLRPPPPPPLLSESSV